MDQAIHEVRNLLAVIHKDGGHHTTEHGLILSAAEAKGIVLKDRDKIAALEAENQRLRELAQELLEELEGRIDADWIDSKRALLEDE